MSNFTGVWQIVSTNNGDDFVKVAFSEEEPELAALFKQLIEDLNFEEHIDVRDDEIHRKCYYKGELFDEVHTLFNRKEIRSDQFGDFSVIVSRIDGNIAVKQEEYVGRPKIIISVIVDEDYMIVHKSAVIEDDYVTVTRRFRRVNKKNTAREGI